MAVKDMSELCARSELASRLEAKLTAGRQRRKVIAHLKLLIMIAVKYPFADPKKTQGA
jgi:hypothetical protein